MSPEVFQAQIIDSISMLVYGKHISEFPAGEQPQVIVDLMEYLRTEMYSYITDNYSKKDAYKLFKTLEQSGETIDASSPHYEQISDSLNHVIQDL